MNSTDAAIKFIVSGIEQTRDATADKRGAAPLAMPAGLTRGTVKQSARVSAARGGDGSVSLTATPGEDAVVLHLVGGPTLVLHPENARDLLLAQAGEQRTRGGATEAEPTSIQVPATLQWAGMQQAEIQTGASRGVAGGVLLSAIEIVRGIAMDKAADLAAAAAVRKVDDQVDAGIYQLSSGALPKLKGSTSRVDAIASAADDRPTLVFIHGTFSNTSGTFEKLWLQHPQYVARLFDAYGKRVYGLEHPTLGESPIDNALLLAKACPPAARLHLATHSRGGLVAEVLARVCANPAISATDLNIFKGAEYLEQRAALQELVQVVAERELRVERVVRVACPARGTLLASKRLDAYLSVFNWSLELAGIPVAPLLVDFLAEVAQRRTDPTLIPGLAAQIPNSPLIQWLHAVDEAIPGSLRVIAGDIQGDSVTSWLKTLLADAYYWTDNDLVVQTRSMYGGAPRAENATFVFDQGGEVSHFNYFFNERTADAFVDALVEEEPPAFRLVGPLSWKGESSTGVRAAVRDGTATPRPDKPAVFVLPGILGSNLKVGDKRIWLSLRLLNGLRRLEYHAGQPDNVAPDGAIQQTYEDLEAFLAKTHEVKEFAYDWRLPLEDEARRLAVEVASALDAREQSRQPVRILAHSMGGLLARTMQLEAPGVWERMMAHDDARLLMLGTPNGGSWAPMQVLSGDDTFGNILVAVGAPFQGNSARQMMAELPGFIQLQAALTDVQKKLDLHATWQKLADDDIARVRQFNSWHQDPIQLNVYAWGVPPQDVLDRAVALRKRLDVQRDGALVPFRNKMLLVAGKSRFTPDGFEVGDQGLDYLNAAEAGDGRVTLSSAHMDGVLTWQIDCEHGKLPTDTDAFDAYLELLATGNTMRLPALPESVASRGAEAIPPIAQVRSRPSRMQPPSPPPDSERDVLKLHSERKQADGAAKGIALKVSVVNGDITFVRQPLMLGHYTSLRLTGTESVVDRLLHGALGVSLDAGLYPSQPGDHQIFINRASHSDNPLQLPRPEAAIVVGLGDENKLRADDLVKTVRQAVIAWSQRLTEQSGAPAAFQIASTLIGSGGIGITAGQAARLIAQGVRDANRRLAESGLPVVDHLHLVELYLDRAGDVWRALQVQAAATPREYSMDDPVKPGVGALQRLIDSGYRGADYDYISALTQVGKDGDSEIHYTLDTKRARSEVHAQQTQKPLLRQLVSSASSDANADPQIGRTLFQLLVPLEMEPFLGGTTDMQLEVDDGTAGIPWEALDNGSLGGAESRPWAIRAKLLRKLHTATYRSRVVDANPDASALIIGEPASQYPRLPGARREANAVVFALRDREALRADRVMALISPDDPDQLGPGAEAVINALHSRPWRIVHIAGHGMPPDGNNPRGVVLSDNTFLGPHEIESLRIVPELVFVNCCYLAARDTAQLLSDRPGFAAGVAQALIQIGVRCVIAAGWAVNDGAASAFAKRFYEELLKGQRFIDAVAEAREAAYDSGTNTWAAYQCYGDPDWRFIAATSDAQRPTPSIADEFSGIAASKTLVLALDTLAVQSQYQKRPPDEQQAKLRHLESRFATLWGRIGEVAEGFGRAWTAAECVDQAMKWYERALRASDGSASLRAVEQLGNLRVRAAWETVAKLLQQDTGSTSKKGATKDTNDAGQTKLEKTTKGSRRAKQREALLDRARTSIAGALELLERVANMESTVERESLCGSAWKRIAMIEAAAADAKQEMLALTRMLERYKRAVERARETNDDGLFYPALNWLAVELIVHGGKRGWGGFDAKALTEIRTNLGAKTRDDPDFWSVVGVAELSMYEAMAAGNLATRIPSIVAVYEDLRGRIDARRKWRSVLDQLRFVLPRYAARASKEERQATTELTRYLEKLAGAMGT